MEPSHKHCAFAITYFRFGNLSLFASYAMLMRPRNLKQLLIRSSIQLARSEVSPGIYYTKQLSMAVSDQAYYFFYGSLIW